MTNPPSFLRPMRDGEVPLVHSFVYPAFPTTLVDYSSCFIFHPARQSSPSFSPHLVVGRNSDRIIAVSPEGTVGMFYPAAVLYVEK